VQINEVLDCESCGACCCNPDENRREGFTSYVEVDPSSKLVKHKRFVVIDERGIHMRLDPAGRCVALKGRLGVRVSCVVYADRPRGCRLVEAGSAQCLLARKERGI
jgi:Fe-S-cluster containining protein